MANTTPTYRTLGLTVPIAELLSPKQWRERYAFGLVLGPGTPTARVSALDKLLGCNKPRAQEETSAVVAEIPDEVIRWHLRVALSDLETRLGTPMGLVVCKSTPVDEGLRVGVDFDKEMPRLPYTDTERAAWYKIDLPAGVVSVERVRAYWFGSVVWSISADDGNAGLLNLEHPGTSSLHLIPDGTSSLLMAAGAVGNVTYGALNLIRGFGRPVPAVWAVDYTLAPTTKYGPPNGTIEAVLAHWCYCKAGVMLLSMGGLARTKGLSNISLSIDGLSRSASWGQYGLHGVLEQRLNEATEAIDWERMRTYKRGLRVVPYGG